MFKVGSGAIPTANDLAASLYETRVTAATAALLNWPTINTSSITFYLTQLYAHALPVKIADCYNQMGQFAKAEEYYLLVLHYTYLNPEAEATSLWIRMARNAVEWGDSLYKLENFNEAKAQYSKLILEDATAPNSFMYTMASLAIPADAAKTLIQNITTRPLPAVNWEITYLVLTAF
jgi:tetratricopeptide (TPR) repeat protein